MKNKFKHAATAIVTVGALLGLVACGSAKPTADPTPKTSPSATSTAPAWEAKFTAAQLNDYNTALATYTSIVSREAPIWANPSKYTATEVARIFNQDWAVPGVPTYRYTSYVANHQRQGGVTKVLSSELMSVQSNSGGTGLEEIKISQCVDGRGITINGEPVTKVAKILPRSRLDFEMFKMTNGQYKLVTYPTSPKKVEVPC